MEVSDNDVRINFNEDYEQEIDLVDLWYFFLQNLKYIVPVVIVITAVVAGLTKFVITPKYTATSKIYVLSSKDSAINLSDLQIGSQLTNDYLEVFKTWEVHEQVKQNLKLSYTHEQMAKMLKVKNPGNTRILEISVESTKAEEARDMSNEYAEVVRSYVSDVMQGDEPSILSEARLPEAPSSPKLTRNIALGFILSFMLAFLIMFIVFVTDDRIKSADDIEKTTGLPTLAVIPKQRS